MATLQIELEDMAGASWWSGVLATLASQSGNAYLRFVGRVDGDRRSMGASVPAPRRRRANTRRSRSSRWAGGR